MRAPARWARSARACAPPRRFGGRQCGEAVRREVRQKSTGSPPAPTSSISAFQACMRSPIFNARPGGGLPAAESRGWRCSASTSAGRSPTPCSSTDGARADGEGADRRAPGGVGARGRAGRRRGRRRAVRARDDRRDERAARAQGRAHGVRRDGGLRAPAPPAPAEPRAPLPALRRSTRSRSCRSSAATASRERIGPDGVLAPLDLASLPALDAEAVAVCLLFSFRDPSHERAVAEELRRRLPHAHVVASHEVAPEFREYERASTTAVDAYLGPLVARYLARARRRGGGGRAAGAARHALVGRRRDARRGGRASGRSCSSRGRPRAWSARRASRRSPAFENAISFDMGGTSTDVCLIVGGARRARGRARRSAGCRCGCRRSTCTPSAPAAARSSGATPAARCASGRESAGAEPGPACYGRGGTRPTVTDANLLLGRLPGAARRRPRARPRRGRARARRDRSRPPSIEVVERRDAARAARRLGRARPRSARARARRVRRRRAAARVRARRGARDAARCSSRRRPACCPRSASSRATSAATACARTSCRSPRPASCRREGEADLRYRGQSFELTVPLRPRPRRGVPPRARGALRLRGPRPRRSSSSRCARPTSRPAPGARRCRPRRRSTSRARRVVELDGATCWVPAGWAAGSGRTADAGADERT